MVVDAGAVAHLAGLISNQDAKLKRQVFSALSQISKHSVDLAEMVVEAEIFPAVLTSLKGQLPACIQWNPSSVDSKWTYQFVQCSEVSLSQGCYINYVMGFLFRDYRYRYTV